MFLTSRPGTATYIATGDLRSAMFAAVAATAAMAVGEVAGVLGQNGLSMIEQFSLALAHGFSQGAISLMSGG